MPELWMPTTRKPGSQALPRTGYEIIRGALLDPATALDVAPVDATAWRHLEALSRSIADPMDALIVATARALGVLLVNRDCRIAEARVVDVI